MPVVWRARALADIGRIVRHIATDNPVAARRVGRELLLAGDSLVMFPRRGRPGRQPGTRELVVMPPYIVVYRITGADTVTILRVWHAAQNRAGSSYPLILLAFRRRGGQDRVRGFSWTDHAPVGWVLVASG